jgi:hypothetical protein
MEWAELQISGNQTVSDLWHQKSLGDFTPKFTAQVPAQGVVMVKLNTK